MLNFPISLIGLSAGGGGVDRTGLVLEYLFAGNSLADTSTNNITGTLDGGATVSNEFLTTNDGALNQSLLGGTIDGNFNLGATGSTWIKSTSGINAYIMACTSNIVNSDWRFQLQAGRIRLLVYCGTGTSNYVGKTSVATVNDDAWHHVGWTRGVGGSDVKLYIDGVRAADTNISSGTYSYTPSTQPIRFGCDEQGTGDFDGQQAKIRLWQRELTPAEMMALFDEGHLN